MDYFCILHLLTPERLNEAQAQAQSHRLHQLRNNATLSVLSHGPRFTYSVIGTGFAGVDELDRYMWDHGIRTTAAEVALVAPEASSVELLSDLQTRARRLMTQKGYGAVSNPSLASRTDGRTLSGVGWHWCAMREPHAGAVPKPRMRHYRDETFYDDLGRFFPERMAPWAPTLVALLRPAFGLWHLRSQANWLEATLLGLALARWLHEFDEVPGVVVPEHDGIDPGVLPRACRPSVEQELAFSLSMGGNHAARQFSGRRGAPADIFNRLLAERQAAVVRTLMRVFGGAAEMAWVLCERGLDDMGMPIDQAFQFFKTVSATERWRQQVAFVEQTAGA